MSTSIDGDPPSMTPGPDDEGPERPVRARRAESPGSGGGDWVRAELERRMASSAGRSGSGGRHARRDGRTDVVAGTGYVPRHSVTHGPPPAGPAPAGAPVRREPASGWSGPEPAPPRDRPDEPQPGRTDPSRAVPDGGAPGGARPSSPEPRPADVAAPGGPSSAGRPVPRAFRPGPRRTEPVDAPAVFGGPGFAAPATRPSARPEEPPGSGGPGPADVVGAPTPGRPGPAGPGRRAGPDAEPTTVDPAARDRPAEPSPPRAAARLLAAPEHVVEALGHRPTAPRRTLPTARPGPDRPAGPDRSGPDRSGTDRSGTDRSDTEQFGCVTSDDDSTILWSASDPTAGALAADPELRTSAGEPDVPLSRRVTVVLSERRNGAQAVRTVVDIQEGGAVGQLLRSDLIRSQLRVALWFAAGIGLTLGLLPLAFAVFPEIGRTEVLGVRLPWLLLGVAVYPFLFGLGWWHTRTAERVEQDFADHVQD